MYPDKSISEEAWHITDYLSFSGYQTITRTYYLNVGSGTGKQANLSPELSGLDIPANPIQMIIKGL